MHYATFAELNALQAGEREARDTEYFTVRAQQPLTPIQGVYVCMCACVLAHSLQHQQEVSRSVEKQWQGGRLQMLGPLPWVVGSLPLSRLVKSEKQCTACERGEWTTHNGNVLAITSFFYTYTYIVRSFQAVTLTKQPVWEAVSYRGLFTAGWFGVGEKHCSRLEIYDRLRASEQAVCT